MVKTIKKILGYRFYLLVPFAVISLRRNSKKHSYKLSYTEAFEICLALAKCNLDEKENTHKPARN